MKKPLLSLLFILCTVSCFSKHIKGGFFSYKYLGAGIKDNTKLNYQITLTIYMDYEVTIGKIDSVINFTISSGTTAAVYNNFPVTKSADYYLKKNHFDPCITGDQPNCYYRIMVYTLGSCELPVSTEGYTISYQRCCRLGGMDNIPNSYMVGSTYTIKIPGTSSPVPNANTKSSLELPINDTVLICENNYFRYSFHVAEAKGDSISYQFCNSLNGGENNLNYAPSLTTAPAYAPVTYSYPYSGAAPLGPLVTINATTGEMSGIAPPIIYTGEYAVTISINRYSNGIWLQEIRKELHIRVKSCTSITAKLKPIPTSCRGFGLKFYNDATNPSGTDYRWTFGDNRSCSNTSTQPTPFHVYTDTGLYLLKLRISNGGLCADSASIPVKIFPGFYPGFKSITPFCKGLPIQFMDTTKTKYGNITGWKWAFKNLNTITDSSGLQQPTITYAAAGSYTVQLVVTNNLGCIDTVNQNIQIKNGPLINLASHDLLRCIKDSVKLISNSTGIIAWSPNYNIDNVLSANPIVYPAVPTTYILTLKDHKGCYNTDSIRVDVMKKIVIELGRDTSICRTDALVISTSSNASLFKWTPATYLNNNTLQSPVAIPLDKWITYQVIGKLGNCEDTASVTINTLPYPLALPKKDTTICFSTSLNLQVSGGNVYEWKPAIFLSATNIANPMVIAPTASTRYIVKVTGTAAMGTCSKAVFDTVLVWVDPLLIARAGASATTVVSGEPVFLNGSGRGTFLWTPATWLNNPNIANPIANPQENIRYHLLVTSAAGCQSRDSIQINLYKVPPNIYVPTAFSPNNDNNNDILKPILLGMNALDYFKVYNRSGQLLYSTTQKEQGWDGYFNGNLQDPATYIWMAQGTMFTGEKIVRKGFAVLLR